MANPVLVEVTRGDRVESVHRGSIVVMDGDGGVLASIGDVERPVFPRSACKAIQALPLVESGAADAYGFGEREIALACASHSGEKGHTETAAAMLAAAGLDENALECGLHWPMREDAAYELAREGRQPGQLHNNCSGKHSGFLCTCRHLGVDHHGYVGAGHKAQELVCEAMESVTGARHGADNRGIDGCSIPTYAIPLRNLALGFARMTTGVGLPPVRAKAARRILAANMAEPFYVAGTDRLDTRLMQAADRRIMAKTGAEGVYCSAVPELGVGVAIKCDDGATRGAETMLLATLAWLLRDDAAMVDTLRGLAKPILSRNGAKVGAERFIGAFG